MGTGIKDLENDTGAYTNYTTDPGNTATNIGGFNCGRSGVEDE